MARRVMRPSGPATARRASVRVHPLHGTPFIARAVVAYRNIGLVVNDDDVPLFPNDTFGSGPPHNTLTGIVRVDVWEKHKRILDGLLVSGYNACPVPTKINHAKEA